MFVKYTFIYLYIYIYKPILLNYHYRTYKDNIIEWNPMIKGEIVTFIPVN